MENIAVDVQNYPTLIRRPVMRKLAHNAKKRKLVEKRKHMNRFLLGSARTVPTPRLFSGYFGRVTVYYYYGCTSLSSFYNGIFDPYL